MAGQNKPGKKLPKRASSARLKNYRAERRIAQEAKKAVRKEAQEVRRARNEKLRAAGVLTAWEQAKEKRFLTRH